MTARPFCCLAVAALLGVAASGDLAAQAVDPFAWERARPGGQTVSNRPRPELDALGLPAGAFRFYPSFELTGRYEDNVFRSENDRRGDFSTVARPRFRLTSEFERHGLEVEADGAVYRYAREQTEDREDFSLGVAGHLDVDRDTRIEGGARLTRRHENRLNPDAGGARRPVRFDTLSASLAGERQQGKFVFRAESEVAAIDYADARRAGARTPINHDDRDRIAFSGALRAGFRPEPSKEVYLRFEGLGRDYRKPEDDGGFDRDSQGVDVRIGGSADIGGASFANAYVGYRGQYFDDDGTARLNEDAIEALILGAGLTSNVTKLTTLYGRAQRATFESALARTPGGVVERAALGAEHELLRNLVLFAEAGGRRLAFEGIDRDDFGLLFQFGAIYRMNRHVTVEAAVEHETTRSSGADQGVDQSSNRLMLRVTAQP